MGWASSIAVVQHIHLKSLSGCFRAERLGADLAVDPHPLCKGDVNALPVCHSARAGAVTGPQVASVSKVDFLPFLRSGGDLCGVVQGGSIPCQGRSRLNASRLHLAVAQARFFFVRAGELQTTSGTAQVLKPDVSQQPLSARATYCNWCGRRCSPQVTTKTPWGVPVHYPCWELHTFRCSDCRRIVDEDEDLCTAKVQAQV